jgi:carbonic anhydrase/acetyltransferase-like protein (isoleucine patch superfamily)
MLAGSNQGRKNSVFRPPKNALVSVHARVPPGTILPAGKRALNVPARIARGVSDEERAYIRFAVETYLCLCPRRTDS